MQVSEGESENEGPGGKRMAVLLLCAVAYLCIGAAVFQQIEGQPEIKRRHDLKALIQDFLGKLPSMTQFSK